MTHVVRRGRCLHCGSLTSWALISQPCPMRSAFVVRDANKRRQRRIREQRRESR